MHKEMAQCARDASGTPAENLFKPLTIGSLELANRIVMAPMTRSMAPDGVPTEASAAYYRARVKGGTGLIVTEGTWVPHPQASNSVTIPRFFGADALAGWARVLEEVHAEGGKIVPQLWHIGVFDMTPAEGLVYEKPADQVPIGPSGLLRSGQPMGRAMTQKDIDAVIDAFATAAASAFALGFDGVELHGAHGYLIDQFFWHETNVRDDAYGGTLAKRTRFAAEIVGEIRRRTAPDFPIILRLSQWKLQNYAACLAQDPKEFESFLAPLANAGVDVFHCSQRRFWEPAFAGSDLNVAGWAKKITGRRSIAVGSVSLDKDMQASLFSNLPVSVTRIDELYDRMDRNEFDLIAVGRALIADANWADKVSRNALDELIPYDNKLLAALV